MEFTKEQIEKFKNFLSEYPENRSKIDEMEGNYEIDVIHENLENIMHDFEESDYYDQDIYDELEYHFSPIEELRYEVEEKRDELFDNLINPLVYEV